MKSSNLGIDFENIAFRIGKVHVSIYITLDRAFVKHTFRKTVLREILQRGKERGESPKNEPFSESKTDLQILLG